MLWRLLAFLIACAPSAALAADLQDALLRKIIRAYQMNAHEPVQRSLGPKERLGQALFFDPFVSGPKTIACATCHVRSLGAGDGNRVAVGLGSEGVGKERLATSSAFLIPRNALPFFNRGRTEFTALFWDGRVQLGRNGRIETPLGPLMPGGFDNLLAAAAVFPMAEPDEMLGNDRTGVPGRTHHGELLSVSVNQNNLQERSLDVFQNIMRRLVAPLEAAPPPVVQRYRALFKAAYPDTSIDDLAIHHVGNALAAYILAAFELRPAPWDEYIKGDLAALTKEQKAGAVLFFGNGRCAVCHSGTQFSDFSFHGLAIPQLRVGKHGRHLDYGRAAATSQPSDRFLFRTPPLRNVISTGPWGHNGHFDSLEAVVEHHFNPIPALHRAQQTSPDEARYAGRLLGSRSTALMEIAPLSKDDVRLIIRFLDALSSSTVMNDAVAIPNDVPSESRQFLRR